MSHYRSLTTQMRDLKILDAVLRERGYNPTYRKVDRSTRGEWGKSIECGFEGCNRILIPAKQIHPHNYVGVQFDVQEDGTIKVITDTDVFRHSDRDNLNRAGGGITREFESLIVGDYAIEAVKRQAMASGFTIREQDIVREGGLIRIKATKDSSSVYQPSKATSSNQVIL